MIWMLNDPIAPFKIQLKQYLIPTVHSVICINSSVISIFKYNINQCSAKNVQTIVAQHAELSVWQRLKASYFHVVLFLEMKRAIINFVSIFSSKHISEMYHFILSLELLFLRNLNCYSHIWNLFFMKVKGGRKTNVNSFSYSQHVRRYLPLH